MYLPFQIDWCGRGYYTTSLYGKVPPEVSDLHNEWVALQDSFASARDGDFGSLANLIEIARETPSGMMRQYLLYLLSDAAPRYTLRALADDALDSWELEYPADVALALIDSGIFSFVPDVLELFCRRCDNAERLPLELSIRIGATPHGVVSKRLPQDDDAEIYRATVSEYHAQLQARLGGPDVPVFRGEVFGVRRFAEFYLDALKNRDSAWLLYTYRRFFEAATGIDMSDCYDARDPKILTTSAKLEAFLSSPEAQRYEHGVRYFWGHRIPD